MTYHLDDTIAAIASPPGGAARGIVRLSGPDVLKTLAPYFRASDERPLDSIKRATVIPGTLLLDVTTTPLPADLYLWPNQRSYTRQPVAELHTIGSPPLLSAVLRALCDAGARLAEPGEFTLRAFLAGRLELTQAEAVLGVIDAQRRREFDTALSQLAGGLAGPLHGLREMLLDALAELEAGLDFVEEDIEFITGHALGQRLAAAIETVNGIATQLSSRAEAADHVRIVLVGWPNVGKSSLFNALAAQSAALVSNQPGTTRDYLTARLDLDGLACQFVDTAGIEPGAVGGIRESAQEQSAGQSRTAHVSLLCLDSTREPNEWERHELESDSPQPRVITLTKCDATRHIFWQDPAPPAKDVVIIETSAATGVGLERLRNQLRRTCCSRSPELRGAVAATALRCGDSLRLAGEALARAVTLNDAEAGEELIAAELRVTLDELGKVVGTVYTDDILDRIFSRFCIGK